LGAVERLDLAFLVDRDDHGMDRRVHVEADDVLDLGGEVRVVGPLEGADAVRLQAVDLPDALHGAEADADRLGHFAAGPVGGVFRRLAARQRQDAGDRRRRQRRAAGLARFVAQQPADALLGEAALPAPHRGPAGAAAPGHLKGGQALRGEQHDARSLHMFLRRVAIVEDGGKSHAIHGADDDADGLGHPRRLAQSQPSVNLLFRSEH
jgi:hypothetical protein